MASDLEEEMQSESESSVDIRESLQVLILDTFKQFHTFIHVDQ